MYFKGARSWMKPMENTSFLDFFGFNSLCFASRAKVCPLCAVGALWWPGSMLGGSKSLFSHLPDWLIIFLTFGSALRQKVFVMVLDRWAMPIGRYLLQTGTRLGLRGTFLGISS